MQEPAFIPILSAEDLNPENLEHAMSLIKEAIAALKLEGELHLANNNSQVAAISKALFAIFAMPLTAYQFQFLLSDFIASLENWLVYAQISTPKFIYRYTFLLNYLFECACQNDKFNRFKTNKRQKIEKR